MMKLTAYTEKKAAVLLHLLAVKGQTVTFAESCTGGGLAAAFTANPGSSQVLGQAYVTYCDEAKAELLGVSRNVLQSQGAVSANVAVQMAKGAALSAGADLAISVTGLAGPGGEGEKPQGLVYIGLAYEGKVWVRRCRFGGSRAAVRAKAAAVAYLWATEVVLKSFGEVTYA